MRLASLLNPRLIICPLQATEKTGALREMAKTLSKVIGTDIEADVMAAVTAREKFGAFTMGHGVSFPHARTDRVGRVWVVLGTSKKGIDFASGDPVRVVVFFVIPKTHSNTYLQTLAAFSNLLKNVNHVEELATAESADEIWNYIDGTGVRVREATFVRDIMGPGPGLVTSRSPLRDGLDVLIASGAEVVPVVDDQGNYVGGLTPRAVVKKGIHTYLSYAGSPAVLSTQSPFEDFLKHHGDIPVADVVDKGVPTFVEDTTLLEAGMTLTRLLRNTAVILRAGKPVGLLRLSDVVKRAIMPKSF